MATRRINRRPLRQSPIGDRRDRITIHVRALTSPVFDSADFREAYDVGIDTWAKVETVDASGRNDFDEVSLAVGATHRFDVRYRPNVTSENIIGYRDEYYQILRIDNPENRNLSLILHCIVKGDDTSEANQ